MKIPKKLGIMLLTSLIASTNISFADSSIFDSAEPIKPKELISSLESAGIKSIYTSTESSVNAKSSVDIRSSVNASTSINTPSVVNDASIEDINIEEGETAVLHSNGQPMNTDIFEDKQGNELFAVSITNKNGEQSYTYYISDSGVLMGDTVEEMIENISKDKVESSLAFKPEMLNKLSISKVSTISKKYNWDFYHTNVLGNKTQQGSLYTEVWFDRKTTSANVDGKTSSVWDVTSRSEVKARSTSRINETYVRLDAGSGSQRLHDFAPETSSDSNFTTSLSGIVQPMNWSITAGGYTTKSLSPGVRSRYGRWLFKSRVGLQHSWVVKPGIRVSNSSGTLYIKYSQTMALTYSNHSTGIVTIPVADR